uniref:Uncharacterized protein n=1 Tax=Amphimedon queenslandica TaxID=400682 RepID=A0A1X7SLS4_AMPQE
MLIFVTIVGRLSKLPSKSLTGPSVRTLVFPIVFGFTAEGEESIAGSVTLRLGN